MGWRDSVAAVSSPEKQPKFRWEKSQWDNTVAKWIFRKRKIKDNERHDQSFYLLFAELSFDTDLGSVNHGDQSNRTLPRSCLCSAWSNSRWQMLQTTVQATQQRKNAGSLDGCFDLLCRKATYCLMLTLLTRMIRERDPVQKYPIGLRHVGSQREWKVIGWLWHAT